MYLESHSLSDVHDNTRDGKKERTKERKTDT